MQSKGALYRDNAARLLWLAQQDPLRITNYVQRNRAELNARNPYPAIRNFVRWGFLREPGIASDGAMALPVVIDKVEAKRQSTIRVWIVQTGMHVSRLSQAKYS